MKELNIKSLSNALLIYICCFVIAEFTIGTFYTLPSFFFLFGGYFGIMFYAFSANHIKNNNISSAFKYMLAGSILIIINLVLFSIPYFYSSLTLFNLLNILIFCSFYIALFYIRKKKDILKDETLIRKTLLDFGTKLTRLKINEIAERTGAFHETIKKVVQDMQDNKEIYARYFKSSNSVVFNQDANIEDIDRLISAFNKWEESKFDKV